MSWILIGLALLCSASALPALQGNSQERGSEPSSYRRITIGRAVLADGKAWSGAEVFFLHRPLPERRDVGRPDLIRVQASPKGRFRVELLERRVYMVWARSKDEKGRVWVSAVQFLVMAGQPIRLVCNKSPSMSETLNLRGWNKPVQNPVEKAADFQLRFGPMHQVLPVAPGKLKDSLVLPPTPYERTWLEALDGKGRVLHELLVVKRSFPIFPLSWRYPVTKRVDLRLLCGKEIVADAEIRIRMVYEPRGGGGPGLESLMPRIPYSRWTSLGRSDAKGLLKLVVSSQAIEGGAIHLQISAPGMLEKFVRLQPVMYNPKGDGAGREPTPIQLVKGVRVKGRILWGEGKPAGNFPFLVLRQAEYKHRKQKLTLLPPGELHRTKSDGSFSFMAPKSYYRIIATVDVELWKKLSASYESLPLPAPELLLHEAPKGSQSTGAIGDLRLDRLVAVDARVPDTRGRGSAQPILLLKDQRDRATGLSAAPHVLARRFGPRGRSVFLMPVGEFASLVIHPEKGSLEETLVLGERMAGTVHRWDVTLAPYSSILVKVRTSEGKAIPGIPLETMGGSYTHLGRFSTQIYKFNTRAIESAVTDEKGDVTLKLMKVADQSYDIIMHWRAMSRMKVSAAPARVNSNDYPESIEIEVGR